MSYYDGDSNEIDPDEKDLPLEQDLDDGSGDLPEMACPQCHGSVTEDTQRCPHCGDWITVIDPGRRGKRGWLFAAAVLLMLYAMMRFIM